MRSLTYTGTLEFDDGVDKTALIAHLADCLRKLDAHEIRISHTSVSFRGGMFRFVSNWNLLGPFGYGELIVNDATHEVRYHLSFRQLAWAATIILGCMSAFALYASGYNPGIPFLVFGFGWLWLVGGNLAIGIWRFRRFLRTAIDTFRSAPRY